MTLEQAKPCPFCGIAPNVISDPAGVHIWCGHVPCFASGTAYGADEAAALRAWNTRHGEVRARAEIKDRCARIAETTLADSDVHMHAPKAGRMIAAAIRSKDDG